MDDTDIIVKFWGVRGSEPTSLNTEDIRIKELRLLEQIIKDGGTEIFLKGGKIDNKLIEAYLRGLPLSLSGTYGGSTTCAEVRVRDSPLQIMDMGTGARKFGEDLARRYFSHGNFNPLNSIQEYNNQLKIILTHFHYDHTLGVTSFIPLFLPFAQVEFFGQKETREDRTLKQILEGRQNYSAFPVGLDEQAATIKYHDELKRFFTQEIRLGNAILNYGEVSHPSGCLAYSTEYGNKKFVFATDAEHRDSPDPTIVRLASRTAKDEKNYKKVVMYIDSQFTPEEYRGEAGIGNRSPQHRFRWGHHHYEAAIDTALRAGVDIVILGHHAPERDDFQVEDMHKRALAYLKNQLRHKEHKGKNLEVIMAYEGLEVKL